MCVGCSINFGNREKGKEKESEGYHTQYTARDGEIEERGREEREGGRRVPTYKNLPVQKLRHRRIDGVLTSTLNKGPFGKMLSLQ